MILSVLPAAVAAENTEEFGISVGPGLSAVVDRHNVIFGADNAQWLVLDADQTTTGEAGINNISPSDLGEDITISVVGLSVTYSPFIYMHRMYYKEGSKRVLRDMMQAMYDYHLYAVAYLAE